MSQMRFGQPWHGTYSAAGLTLENGTLHPEWLPPEYATDTHYINLGAPTPAALLPHEIAAGISWKNDIVLAGFEKHYGVSAPFGLGAHSWLYKATDGTIYRISVGYLGASGAGTVTANRFGAGPLTQILTFTIPIETILPPESRPNYFELNQAPNGSKCLLCLGYTKTGVRSDSRTYEMVDRFMAILEFTLSAGSVSAPPTATYSVLYDPTTMYTEVDWYNPANHSANGFYDPKDTLSEESHTTRRICFGGYDRNGDLHIFSTERVEHSLLTEVGPTWNTYRHEATTSWGCRVKNNSAIVYTATAANYSSTWDITNGARTNFVINNTDTEYYGEEITTRHLSNCLVAFGLNHDIGASEVLYVCSVYGVPSTSLLGLTYDGSDLDSVTLAACNPRTGQVALGLDSGFV